MSNLNLHAIAASLYAAGAPGDPTALLAQDVTLYEVEFAALEYAEDSKLRSADWAVLALARVLGHVSPALADEYLGLGDIVSEAIVHRLVEEHLLQHGDITQQKADGGIMSFFQQFLKSTPRILAPLEGAPTQAQKLYTSSAPTTPLCWLTDIGTAALNSGRVPLRRERTARLVFLAEPLMFIKVEDEKQQRNTQFHRPPILPPQEVPASLRALDTVISLPPEERMAACGIAATVPGLSGQLLRIVPGSQWEVRKVCRPVGRRLGPQAAALVMAAFHSTADGLTWRTFLWQDRTQSPCRDIDIPGLIDAQTHHPTKMVAAILASHPSNQPMTARLRNDGAYELPCSSEDIPNLIGNHDRPCDVLMLSQVDRWQAGLRIHAVPADRDAARKAFYAFLRRSNAALQSNFDLTCDDVASSLAKYWNGDFDLPSADEAAADLWSDAQLRAALCMRRLHRDLVLPYLTEAEQV